MNISVLRNAILIMAAVIILAVPAAAERNDYWLLGFDIGATEFDSSLSSGSNLRLAVRASWHPNQRLGVELEASTAQAIFDLNLETTFLNALVRISPPDRTLTGYFKAGIGHVQIESDRLFFLPGPGPEVNVSGLGAQIGIGLLMLRPGRRVGARIEATSLFEGLLDDGVHVSGSVGLVVRLGG